MLARVRSLAASSTRVHPYLLAANQAACGVVRSYLIIGYIRLHRSSSAARLAWLCLDYWGSKALLHLVAPEHASNLLHTPSPPDPSPSPPPTLILRYWHTSPLPRFGLNRMKQLLKTAIGFSRTTATFPRPRTLTRARS